MKQHAVLLYVANTQLGKCQATSKIGFDPGQGEGLTEDALGGRNNIKRLPTFLATSAPVLCLFAVLSLGQRSTCSVQTGTVLLGSSLYSQNQHIVGCYGLNYVSPNSCVGVITPRISECDRIEK